MLSTHVLMADDNPDLLELFTEILNDAGLEVLAASTGAEALRLLRVHSSTIRLAVLDVHMPAPSGLQLATMVRDDPAFQLISVVLTTADDPDTLPGTFTVLAKPFDPATLIAYARHPWTANRSRERLAHPPGRTKA